MKEEFKVWIEVSKKVLKKNFAILKRKLKSGVHLWAVVKSNAYGHGLFLITPFLEKIGVNGFCVDSVLEGRRLRQEKVKGPILVLGPTLERWLAMAGENRISVTISSWEFLKAYANTLPSLTKKPSFHLKIDTGMHRQGFFISQLPKVLQFIRAHKFPLKGVYTHFADSADAKHRRYTEEQFHKFMQARRIIEGAGFKELIFHCANSAAVLTSSRYHLDTVRIGNALYGLSPSRSWEPRFKRLGFKPALEWKARISEVKKITKGERVGYGLVGRARQSMTLALIPIGFWHGYPWSLYRRGEVLIAGTRAPIVGRISMDMMAIDVTGLPVRVGSVATLIGTDKKEMISARTLATILGIRPQEIVTRINPLIHRELE